MKVLGVIPARLGSTRLTRKPLQLIKDKPLIAWVLDAARQCKTFSRLIVATDSEEIAAVVKQYGGEVMMTDPSLNSGSERAAEVVDILGEQWDGIVNIQGDMPFISAQMVDEVVSFTLKSKTDFAIGTAATIISDPETFAEKANVKVVLGADGRALYFSRSQIPCSRDGDLMTHNGKPILGYKHLGLYVYKPRGLELFRKGAVRCELEDVEKLEQLRALAMGELIGVYVIEGDEATGLVEVDTAEDLQVANEIAK